VTLRRSAALRLSQQEDRAAELATRVRTLAVERGDRAAELAACVALGQAVLHAGLGEGFTPSAAEVDLDAAEEAYMRAAALAEELGDVPMLAAATRELGVVDLGRVRGWFVDQMMVGAHVPVMERVASGEAIEDLVEELPIAPWVKSAGERLHRALALYEELGDRQGTMASIIAMAYLSWAPDIHIGADSARHIEEIRRLATQLASFTSESQRAFAEVQMLYGVHVFARAKVIPDLALSRGAEAYERARSIGDRQLEFLAAGGTAMSTLELGDLDEAATWLDRAATVGVESPTPSRGRQLELWRGQLDAARGDAERMRGHLERAVQMAADQGLPAARCEALAALALAAAALGSERDDEELRSLAERSASGAKELFPLLPGHAPWGAKADAALATLALSRGEPERAVEAARSAIAALQEAQHEDLDLDVLMPLAAAVTAAGTDEERARILSYLRLQASVIANRIVDEEIRSRWFRGPVGSALAAVALDPNAPIVRTAQDVSVDALGAGEADLLKLVVQGLSNDEIAERLEVDPSEVSRRLASMYAAIGASSRADATAFAFQSRIL
jgi:DNA-binding CsgD family transcriptional regulator/tetratricopeptide (TPR) repeat protein